VKLVGFRFIKSSHWNGLASSNRHTVSLWWNRTLQWRPYIST